MVGLFDHLNQPRPPLYGDTPTQPYEPQPLGLIDTLRYYAGPHVTQSAENVLGLAKALAGPVLSVLPGSGEAMSAQDSMRQSREALAAALQGNFGQAGIGGVNSLISALGAVPLYGMMARETRPIVNALLDMPQSDLTELVKSIRAPGNAVLNPPSKSVRQAFREAGLDASNPEHMRAYRDYRNAQQAKFQIPERSAVPPQSAIDQIAPQYLDAAMREFGATTPNWDVLKRAEEIQTAERIAKLTPAERLGANEGQWTDARQVVEQLLAERGYKLVGASQNYRSLYYAHPGNPSRRIRLSDHPQGVGHAEFGRVNEADNIVIPAETGSDRVYISPRDLREAVFLITKGNKNGGR